MIEWAAERPWSTGKVASSGISWLAMMGWRVAALQPPHLAAVVAWEGLTDFYREAAYQGGLYSNGFIEFWWKLQIEPQRNGAEGADWREQLPRHPLLDEFHARAQHRSGPGVRAAAVGGQLGRVAPSPARERRGLAPGRLGAQVAGGAHGHAHRPVLRRLGARSCSCGSSTGS